MERCDVATQTGLADPASDVVDAQVEGLADALERERMGHVAAGEPLLDLPHGADPAARAARITIDVHGVLEDRQHQAMLPGLPLRGALPGEELAGKDRLTAEGIEGTVHHGNSPPPGAVRSRKCARRNAVHLP